MAAVQNEIKTDDAARTQWSDLTAGYAMIKPILDDALEAAGGWLWESDAALRITEVIGPPEGSLGLSGEDLMGKPILDTDERMDEPESRLALDRLKAHERFRGLLHAIDTPQGLRWVRISGKPVVSPKGIFQGYRGFAFEVTEEGSRQRPAAPARHFMDAIELLPSSLLLCDADDRIVLYNSATRDVLPKGARLPAFGMRFEDFLRSHVESGLLPAAGPDPERWIAERMAEHRAGKTNAVFRYSDGRFVHLVERRTSDGGIIGIRLDVTEQKRREQELEELGDTLRQSEEHLKRAQHISRIGSVERDFKTGEVKWSDECRRMFGRRLDLPPPDRGEFLKLVHPDDRALYEASVVASEKGLPSEPVKFRVLHGDGSVHWIYCESSVQFGPDGQPAKRIAAYRDVTDEHDAQERLRSMAESLRHGQEVLALAQRAARTGSIERDIRTGEVFWSEEVYRIFGRDRRLHAPRRTEMLTLFHPEDAPKYEAVMAASELGAPVSDVQLRILRPDGEIRLLELNAIVLFDDRGVPRRRISAYRDVTDEHEAREALKSLTENLRRSREYLSQAQRLAHMGSDYRDLRQGFGPDQSAEWSDMNYEIFGVDKGTFVPSNDNFLKLVHPDDRHLIAHMWEEIADGKNPAPFEYRIIRPDGALRYIYRETAVTFDANGQPLHMVGTIHDITEKRAAADELRQKTRELEDMNRELKRSNGELEQFAYVASHDLQEPLRMVASYCQLLQRRYKNKLDSDADEFIAYAVDGANRMQQLINDLLSYSRVGRKSSDFEAIEFSDVVASALANLRAAISDSAAKVEVGDLPRVLGARLLLTQLMQNLIGNAIKFRRDQEPPAVRVDAAREGAAWHFVVEDNGIGIEKDYLDRVFLIFQRLHERNKYPGTGIGLAIAKKVIEYHGGRIWIESTPGRGSRFHFTLPDAG